MNIQRQGLYDIVGETELNLDNIQVIMNEQNEYQVIDVFKLDVSICFQLENMEYVKGAKTYVELEDTPNTRFNAQSNTLLRYSYTKQYLSYLPAMPEYGADATAGTLYYLNNNTDMIVKRYNTVCGLMKGFFQAEVYKLNRVDSYISSEGRTVEFKEVNSLKCRKGYKYLGFFQAVNTLIWHNADIDSSAFDQFLFAIFFLVKDRFVINTQIQTIFYNPTGIQYMLSNSGYIRSMYSGENYDLLSFKGLVLSNIFNILRNGKKVTKVEFGKESDYILTFSDGSELLASASGHLLNAYLLGLCIEEFLDLISINVSMSDSDTLDFIDTEWMTESNPQEGYWHQAIDYIIVMSIPTLYNKKHVKRINSIYKTNFSIVMP